MRYRILLALAAIFCLIAGSAAAQSGPFEVGFHFSMTQRQSVTPVLTGGTEAGFGGRAAVYVARAVRVEGELDVFPQDAAHRGWRTSGLFGVVAGKRWSRFGVFGKARAGFLRYSQAVPSQVQPGQATFRTSNPAMDFGAVIEGCQYRQLTLRLDLGDTVAQIGNISCPYLGCTATAWQHNLQVNAGIGLRF